MEENRELRELVDEMNGQHVSMDHKAVQELAREMKATDESKISVNDMMPWRRTPPALRATSLFQRRLGGSAACNFICRS